MVEVAVPTTDDSDGTSQATRFQRSLVDPVTGASSIPKPHGSSLYGKRHVFRVFRIRTAFLDVVELVSFRSATPYHPSSRLQLARVLEPGPFVDLFSGAGGMSLGFELAGFPLVVAIDNDASALETFARNRADSDATLRIDLAEASDRQVALKEIERRVGRGKVELLVGGPPCQGFSTAGNCAKDDPRNHLVFAFLEMVEKLQPRTVIMENVPALGFRGKQTLDEIRRQFQSLGYNTAIIVAHLEAYGVPQLRRRLFLMAGPNPKWPRPWRRMETPYHLSRQPDAESALRAAPPFTVEDALADLPREEATDPDHAVCYGATPTSIFQAWARGEAILDRLIPANMSPYEPATLF